MIRVLQILTIMNRGGAETMVMNYYRHIDRTKVQFDFLVLRQEPGAYDAEIEALGGRIYRIPPIFNLIPHQKAISQFFHEHPEYRIIHGHVGELGYFIYKEAKRRGIPTIIAHAHNASADRDYKRPLRWVLKHLIRPYITHPMTCGREAAIWLFGKRMGEQAHMLNNAIDAEAYRYNERTREEVRREMGWEGHFVIGDVARFAPQKNHTGLLCIFQAVLETTPNALLVLIGSKEDLYEHIATLAHKLDIEKSVQFLGSRTDIAKLMQGMDVYCSPSHYEGLSVSMVEAQAAGLRVITSTNVPSEVEFIPGLVDFVDLDSQPNDWRTTILKKYQRVNAYRKIVESGYDVKSNVRILQEKYIKLHTPR